MGESVSLVSSSDETAKDAYRVLADHDLLREDGAEPQHHFTTTGDPHEFTRLARRFLGPEVISVTGHRHFVADRGEVVR
jgi:glutamate racemase